MKTEKQKIREAASVIEIAKLDDALEAQAREKDGLLRVSKARRSGQVSIKVTLDEAQRLYERTAVDAAFNVWCISSKIEDMFGLVRGTVERRLEDGAPLDFTSSLWQRSNDDGTGETP